MKTENASWTYEGIPEDLNAICANCGFDRGSHRAINDQCPESEESLEWRKTRYVIRTATAAPEGSTGAPTGTQ